MTKSWHVPKPQVPIRGHCHLTEHHRPWSSAQNPYRLTSTSGSLLRWPSSEALHLGTLPPPPDLVPRFFGKLNRPPVSGIGHCSSFILRRSSRAMVHVAFDSKNLTSPVAAPIPRPLPQICGEILGRVGLRPSKVHILRPMRPKGAPFNKCHK